MCFSLPRFSSVFLYALCGEGLGFPPPTQPVFTFCCKQRCFRKFTLGRRLRHAWVALAWPLGGPRVTQTQSQSAEGRKTKTATVAVDFSGQKPRANSQKPNCQISLPFNPSGLLHPSALFLYIHARSCTPGAVMPFATHCLSSGHVRVVDLCLPLTICLADS
jgi:hypothetical protein